MSSPQPQELSEEAIREIYNGFLGQGQEPSLHLSYEAITERSNRASNPTPVTDADGTSRIYYGPFDRPISYFPRPSDVTMAAIRNVELHFHLREKLRPCMAAILGPRHAIIGDPSMQWFQYDCPIWHFVGPRDGSPRPALTIFVERYGESALGVEYEDMLNLLLGLMQRLPEAGYENVVVRVALVPDNGVVRATEEEMRVLRCRFEDQMGEATTVVEGDAWRMEFCPRSFVESQRRRAQFPTVEAAPELYRARAYVRESRMAAAERRQRSA